jgi:hypothetical protein
MLDATEQRPRDGATPGAMAPELEDRMQDGLYDSTTAEVC